MQRSLSRGDGAAGSAARRGALLRHVGWPSAVMAGVPLIAPDGHATSATPRAREHSELSEAHANYLRRR